MIFSSAKKSKTFTQGQKQIIQSPMYDIAEWEDLVCI